jgi:PTS system nitrogen regulatory IIA component
MDFATILSSDAVKILTSASSKKRLMQEIGELVSQAYALEADQIVDALITRESLGPTGVGHGVALPHARLEGLDRVVGAFVLLDKPIDFDSVDRQPVDVAFALFAPADAGVEHLKALALVSRTLRNPSICNKLRNNPDAGTIYAILTEENAIQAA